MKIKNRCISQKTKAGKSFTNFNVKFMNKQLINTETKMVNAWHGSLR